MKIFLTGGYGDYSVGSYLDMADDVEAQRVVDVKGARTLASDPKDENFVADNAATFVKVAAIKPKA